jgi:hypothetical protein
MCDYSLQHIASRPAKVGDELVSTSFSNSSTRGFAAVGEPNVAVCLLPGTEIAFEKDVEHDDTFGLFARKIHEKVARFRQIDMDKPHTHHDALEFPGGSSLLVTRLSRGQRVTVLQLPASPRAEKTVETRPNTGDEHYSVSFVA